MAELKTQLFEQPSSRNSSSDARPISRVDEGTLRPRCYVSDCYRARQADRDPDLVIFDYDQLLNDDLEGALYEEEDHKESKGHPEDEELTEIVRHPDDVIEDKVGDKDDTKD